MDVGFAPVVAVAPSLDYATFVSTDAARPSVELDRGAEMMRNDVLPQRGQIDASLLTQSFRQFHQPDVFDGMELRTVDVSEPEISPIAAPVAAPITAAMQSLPSLPNLDSFELAFAA